MADAEGQHSKLEDLRDKQRVRETYLAEHPGEADFANPLSAYCGIVQASAASLVSITTLVKTSEQLVGGCGVVSHPLNLRPDA